MKNSGLCIVILFLGFIFSIGCSRKTGPLQSTLHTEAIHHKWQIKSINNYDGVLPYSFIDLRDVYHSKAATGCDTLLITPRFGYNDRIQLADRVSSSTSQCLANDLKTAFTAALADAARYAVSRDHLELKSKKGTTLLKADLDPADEKGSIQRKWNIISLISANADTLLLQHPFIDLTDLSSSTAYLGCNNLNFNTELLAPYIIRLGDIRSTRKYCAGNAAFETILTKAAPLVAKYQVIGNRLKLFDKDNVLLLEGVSDLRQ